MAPPLTMQLEYIYHVCTIINSPNNNVLPGSGTIPRAIDSGSEFHASSACPKFGLLEQELCDLSVDSDGEVFPG